MFMVMLTISLIYQNNQHSNISDNYNVENLMIFVIEKGLAGKTNPFSIRNILDHLTRGRTCRLFFQKKDSRIILKNA